MSLKSQRGMTLVEVVIAVAIFGIVAAVLTGFFLIASARGLLGRDVTTAALLAHQRIEFLRTKDYGTLGTFAGTDTVDSLGNADPSGAYARTTAITVSPLSPNLTQIDVTVSWMDQDIPRTLMLSTLVVDN